MNQINMLRINGLKSYVEDTEIKLNNLNVFSGVNSVGKSTAIQSLLLLKLLFDNYRETSREVSETYLNSEKFGLELGTYEKIITGNNDFFEIGLNNLTFQIEKKEKDSLKVSTEIGIHNFDNQINIVDNRFYYLSAERIGPRNYQKIDSLGIENCGIKGENSFHILNKYADDIVDEGLLYDKTATRSEKTLKKQTETWLNSFFEGVEFSSTLDTALRLVKLEVKQKNHDMGYVSLNNVGFGLSYVLPIILTCLISEENSLIIIENPEAHLHPKGQSLLGQFLAQISSSHRQVIIETHSEHVINGMRLYYLKKKMDEDSLVINFFSIEDGRTKVSRIPLNNRLELLEWPDDFFDQQENDLKNMRIIRRNYD